MYGRTNKKNTPKDISRLEERSRKLRDIESRIITPNPSLSYGPSEPLSKTSPDTHYHMALSSKNNTFISAWVDDNEDDPALVVSYLFHCV